MPVRSGSLLQPVPKASSRTASGNIHFVCVIESLLLNGEVCDGSVSGRCLYMATGQNSSNQCVDDQPAKTDQPHDGLLHGNADGDTQEQAAIHEGKKEATE